MPFIVLEGIDGSGSTTQGERLASRLRSHGKQVFATHEPTGGPAGMLIRLALSRRLRGAAHAFHDPSEAPADSDAIDPVMMALLYAADRADHVATEIAPNLARGRVVICDRYLLSTLAYQGEHLDEEWLYAINQRAPVPDLTIHLDLPVEDATTRMRRTRWTKDLYEDEARLRHIRHRYLEVIARNDPRLGRVEVIDGSQEIDIVSEQIGRLVDALV